MKYKLERLNAYEIGRLVNKRIISPLEVVDYFIERINKRNPSINAFTYLKVEEARKEAKRIEERLNNHEDVGPFAGVPFALKDFLPSKKGWNNSKGGVKSLVREDPISSVFCEAMEKAGGIAIGKCNAPSFGFSGLTYNKMYGLSKNPFNTLYNPGGSSGGSASAVADGLVIIAEGGDAGGSIRIPSSFCNLFGYKASVGTIPSVIRPDAWSATHPYCCNGGLTKSVKETAILLNYMAKYDPRDPLSIEKHIDYVKEMKKSIKGKRIAFTYDFDLFNTDQRIKDKLDEAKKKFEELGAIVEPIHFHFKHDKNYYAEVWCRSIVVDNVIELELEKENGLDLLKDCQDELPKEFIYYINKSKNSTVFDYYIFNVARTEIYDAFQDVFDKYDLIISPISEVPPFRNDLKEKTYESIKDNDNMMSWSETFLVNFTGHPAASIPLGLIDNLPVGMQLIGKRFHDEEVLRFAYAYEKIAPWKKYYKIPLSRK